MKGGTLKTALMIVDMQDYFLDCPVTCGCNPEWIPTSLVDRIIQRVRRSIKNNEWILVVQFECPGSEAEWPLNACLAEALKSYKKVTHIRKRERNGAGPALASIRRHKIEMVEVCGVYTTYCVHDTAQGLIERKIPCFVNLDLCSEPWSDKESCLSTMRVSGIPVEADYACCC